MTQSRLLFTFIILMISSVVPAHAQRVIAVSETGTMRMLANPGCSGASCQWVDIDRNPDTIAVASTQDTLFQIHGSGAIWRWRDLPCADGACPYWSRIDNNPRGEAIAANDTDLFQLHDTGAIWRWLGEDCGPGGCGSWEWIGNDPDTVSIVAAGSLLFRLDSNGEIWRWGGRACRGADCSSWQSLDNNPRTVEIDYAARGVLFQRHDTGAIWRWDGQPCGSSGCRSWTRIDNNAATADIHAAPGNLFQRHSNGNVWRWRGQACNGNSCPHWDRIGSSSNWRDIAAGPQPYTSDFSTADPGPAPVYAVTADGRVERWPGANCTTSCLAWTDLGQGFTGYSSSRGGLYVFPGDPPASESRMAVIPQRPGDRDGDGLPDEWETERASWGLNPSVANMIVVPVLRPDVAESDRLMEILEENLEKTRQFFADLPLRTTGGSRGIHIVYQDGNPLSDFYREDHEENVIDYRAVRSVGMPSELIGYAHGLLIGVGTGGGGQASGRDWAGVSNNFQTFVHELGHQLELGHTPPGHPASPLYTSLMNYDYNYSFNGDASAIHFSQGRFEGITLNERDLDEVLPYSETELGFLDAWPYEYEVEAQSPGTASVDWNRNGVHAERSISADVNDGYALGISGYSHPSDTTADVAIAAQGDLLAAFTSHVHRADVTSYDGAGASDSSPARLGYAVLRDDTVVQTGRLSSAAIMTGAPSAVAKDGRIIVAFPGLLNTVQVGVYQIGADGTLNGRITGFNPGARREVALVDVGDTSSVQMVLWDPATRQLETRRIGIGGSGTTFGDAVPIHLAGGSTRLDSGVPPGVTFNTNQRAMVILNTEDDGDRTNRLKLWTLRRGTEGAWSAADPRWLSTGNARTPGRPAIVFDGSARAGGDGRYLTYFRSYEWAVEEDSGFYKMYAVRATLPETVSTNPESPYRNRFRRYINEWTYSRNGPAVTPYKDDFAVVWRTHERHDDEAARNQAEVNLYASGESSSGAADFNDVKHIAEFGLWRSITAVRE